MTDLANQRLTPEVWRQLNAQNVTNSEIARRFSIEPSAVSNMLRYYGIEKPQTRAQKMWPWKIEGPDLLHAAACEHLRRHVAWMTDGRKGMSMIRKRRLWNFYSRLCDDRKVVEFDPDIPPIKGVSSAGGWAYRDRELRDEDLIIRVNKLIVPEIDDEFREFWSIPDAGEWPKLVGRYD